MSDWLIPLAAARTALFGSDHPFVELMTHGSLTVELYAPLGQDNQTPHERDEVYVVVSGSGMFRKAGERRPFKAGDVIFVEAGVEHRFEGFTDDFQTWVIFYGPKGGETAAGV